MQSVNIFFNVINLTFNSLFFKYRCLFIAKLVTLQWKLNAMGTMTNLFVLNPMMPED